MYYGDIRLGDTIDIKFTSRTFSTGAPGTLSSSPVISAYPGNSTTELTAGITLSVDFDSRTGLNNVRVVATSGNGYATATNYFLVITTGTVGGVSVVGEVVGSFSIECRSALMPATAGRTLVVDAAGLADANAVKVGPSGSGTAQTAGDIMADTNDIQTRLPAALVSGRMDCSVGAMASGVLTATAIAADAITAAKIADGAIDAATFAAGAINAAAIAADAITDAKVAADVTIASVTGAVGSVTGNVGGNVTGSVGSVAAGGITASSLAADSITAAKVAADVTTEITSGLATASSLSSVASDVSAVKAKTDNLPSDPADASDIAALFTALPAAVWAYVIEGSYQARQLMRGFASALLGKGSGLATTTAVYRDTGDSKDRITATVDASGNRSAVTLDLS